MRILIVEDDVSLGLFLQKGLKLEGHEVEWVGDGVAALEHAAEHVVDLMVLDLGLPKMDGMEVLEKMSEEHSGTAVLVLTGRNVVEERVRCLDLGADDCVVKPFSFYELTARCRALLRRRARSSGSVLVYADLLVDRMERTVARDGQTLELTAKEFGLLEYLLVRRGQCCSRGELLREVFEMEVDAPTNVVDVYVNYLRRKLATLGPELAISMIETVRGKGYRVPPMGRPNLISTAETERSAGARA